VVDRRTVVTLLGGVLLLLAEGAASWGLIGHRLVVERAVELVPGELGRALRAEERRLEERSLDPDLLWRKECGRQEGIQHFFDVDLHGGDPAKVSRDLEELKRRQGAAAVEGAGLLPWRIAEMAECARDAIEKGEPDLALDLMGQLAHYSADLHMPFHLTSNYDGQETGQQGIHHRYEDGLVARNTRALLKEMRRVRPRAEAIGDPLEASFAAMAGAPRRVERALSADREVSLSLTPETPEYYRALWSRLDTQVAAELSAAARFTASLWLWAWERGGKFPLTPPSAGEEAAPGGKKGKR